MIVTKNPDDTYTITPETNRETRALDSIGVNRFRIFLTRWVGQRIKQFEAEQERELINAVRAIPGEFQKLRDQYIP